MTDPHPNTDHVHSTLDQGKDNVDGNQKEGLSTAEANIITQRNQAQSPLLRLPREVRDIIATYALSNYNIGISPDYRIDYRISSRPYWTIKCHDANRKQHDWQCIAALTLTCQQLNAEYALMPYSLNMFQVDFQYDNPFSERQCAAIRYIGLHHAKWMREDLDFLTPFNSLKECTVSFIPTRHCRPAEVVKAVKEAVGEGVVVNVDNVFINSPRRI
ncbi:hypothetical protein PtrSN002B_006076 [Pyrenophora tritici-repentis]|uniref:Uncharacterized protein n=2 Tax=Pyrenophora tritici-repentis TaxID=45151 RepID=A0A2W1HUS3_9PLEO|nr:uncharacterized protein PTRG_07778 [Pyrenophora tritici-repentis Pt-1C-BFP]KAA8616896.1 hypothetical protein PtrV1_10197 [Pyrenophora tritici-repentis]EDU50697.1 predicted protein [Pyrenophora tritici-repentis Pt-1C-BFP]KAF7446188.1 hypothetical protein A1F99_094790 [Pyrenophora tritici-repentis]KAF7567292.1 hypothetical protein PtrM4_138830 [Pyrenophora tritici-repentis]KAG9381890.1 hypothetical protein A1F94_007544 [Pyrenophora tritici-repentis]